MIEYMDSDKIHATAYLQRIVSPLMDWFSKKRRKLPWREKPLPYYVWVSEIMLQQTRVEAVKPYFSRFLEALPDVKALADCPEEKLVKLWEGLGYYSRVRNLQKAARIIVDQYGGVIPESAGQLVTLPGIGSYTAAAVSSIAYGKCEAAVDGNVLRVVSRILADASCIDEVKVRKEHEKNLKQVIALSMKETGDGSGDGSFNFPGTFNQAMMELGALVCLPSGEPDCGNCPLSSLCMAHREGKETCFPVRKAKKARRVEDRTVLVIVDGEYTVLHKRPASGLLAGLWELPAYEGKRSAKEAAGLVRNMGLAPVRIVRLEDAKHIFSHVEWHMSGYLILVEMEEHGDMTLHTEEGTEYLLIRAGEAGRKYAIPAAYSSYMKYLGLKPRAELLKERKDPADPSAEY